MPSEGVATPHFKTCSCTALSEYMQKQRYEKDDAGNGENSCKNYDEREVMKGEKKRERMGAQMRL